MIDPGHAVEITSGELWLAVALKTRLLSPYDASSLKQSPLATEQIEDQYLNRIAETLPQRQGESLVRTAITLLTTLVQRKETTTAQFQAAREAIIRNFATVNEYQIDWLLNAYGKYLADERMVPALQEILRTQHAGLFTSTRSAVFKQLFSLSPAGTKPFLIEEICDSKSLTEFDVLAGAPFDSFLRKRLNSPYARQASEAAYEISAHGPREDQAILRKRLDGWNAKWSNNTDLPQDEAALQAELIRAVIHGLNWQLSKEEADVLRRQCQSDLCRSQLGVKD